MRLSRVEDELTRDCVRTWLRTARFALPGGGDDAVTPAEEQRDWDVMCDAVGNASTR